MVNFWWLCAFIFLIFCIFWCFCTFVFLIFCIFDFLYFLMLLYICIFQFLYFWCFCNLYFWFFCIFEVEFLMVLYFQFFVFLIFFVFSMLNFWHLAPFFIFLLSKFPLWHFELLPRRRLEFILIFLGGLVWQRAPTTSALSQIREFYLKTAWNFARLSEFPKIPSPTPQPSSSSLHSLSPIPIPLSLPSPPPIPSVFTPNPKIPLGRAPRAYKETGGGGVFPSFLLEFL